MKNAKSASERQEIDDDDFFTSTPKPLGKAVTYLSLVALGSGIALGGNYWVSNGQTAIQTTGRSAIAQSNSSVPLSGTTNFVTEVVERVGPAVVRINASRTVATEMPEAFNDPFFRRFFGNQVPDIPDTQVQRGSGSGFIISSDGKILTNAHVVEGADTVQVKLKDGRTFEGKVMGSDRLTDVAVIQIDAQDLPVAKTGNSDGLNPGEWAIAIGNPLGLDNTVTTGIISATGRSGSQIGVSDTRVAFIQTDAAINPGNSGGPLLNIKGEVIGINTAIIRGAQGLGFSIPINKAQEIADQLIAKGKVEHPYLGVQMVSLTPEIKAEFERRQGGNIADEGILIVGVMRNSPAAKAGLKVGDAIAQIDNRAVKDASDVQQIVEQTPVGDNLPLKVQRNGRALNLEIQVGVVPQNP
ncbi:trypsin-like peptidase domain-containing protein [Lusitaniella coriacea LEGE 07157]|uniref:Trypsin-like peptidase domain-containing protein n=1 Tax=Lusitaniella coriacea LEGE 07157 TaxID=945747 RepID=A0A8J7DVI8_9CYAN|nr:HhoA/HhoB/HtrA family serine endopeptidase [Lusitaniella coriacea]MBE9115854.1 trypsin-like peptidase domain-containing protein [Lusitaniella coriacea LEGE 07157]